MSLHSYRASRVINDVDYPFDALIMAAMRKADTWNTALLRNAFPNIWEELQARYEAPDGVLESEA